MPSNKSEILQQQKVAFFEAYQRIRKENSKEATLYPKQWLIHKTLNSEAPQTFISEEVAQDIVCKMEAGTYTPYKRELTEERNQNLYRTYLKLVEETKEKNELVIKTILVSKALYMPTPKFYIDSTMASRIVFQFDKEAGR